MFNYKILSQTAGPASTSGTPPTTPIFTFGPSPHNSTGAPHADDVIQYRYVLLALYILVLTGGTVSMSLMIGELKSNMRSVTTMAVLNLMAVHVFFLLTVPFRVYYYAVGHWALGSDFCRLVSAMIHAHMYLTLVFYVVLLWARYVAFFKKSNSAEFYRTLHAVGTSLLIWVVILCTALPPAIVAYGSRKSTMEYKCFHFGEQLTQTGVAVINYILSAGVIVMTLVLTPCQIWILTMVCRRHRNHIHKYQEFWVQIKNLCFLLVMVVCFMPYSVFRIYYVQNVASQDELEGVNEVFLAFTTLSCLDMLALGANRYCRAMCCPA